MNNKTYLDCLFDSDKPLIIYRVKGGFDVYTDFSKKINITKYNAKNFGDDHVNQFYRYYMLEETPPSGEPFPELKSALLHEHSCFLPKEENDAG